MEQGRLFKIVYHLLDKGRATAPELAEKFEVSVRTMAYAVKMAYKKTAKGEYDDFAVYPLEGVWQKIENCELIKEKLRYTLVIRQPDFVGEGGVCAALERTKHRKLNPLLEEVRFASCRAKPVCSFCMSARMTMSRFLSQKWTNLYTPTA